MIKKWSVWPVAAQLECEKKIKTVEESTSAEGCGFPPCGLFTPCVSLSGAFFYLWKGAIGYELEVYLPRLWDALGL